MTRSNDIKPDNDTLRLQHLLSTAFGHGLERGRDGSVQLVFMQSNPMHEVFAHVSRLGTPEAYAAAAAQFIVMVDRARVPREARSLLIASLLLAMRESSGNGTLREKVVSHATPFVNVILRDRPQWLVEWAEDAGPSGMLSRAVSGVPGFSRLRRFERLRLVSGTLFAASFDQRVASVRRAPEKPPFAPYTVYSPLPFWDLAVRSARFPMEIFSAPCPSDEGVIYSDNRIYVVQAILAFASDGAARAISRHIHLEATNKNVSTYVPDADKWHEVETACSTDELRRFRHSLLRGIDASAERRSLVMDPFGASGA